MRLERRSSEVSRQHCGPRHKHKCLGLSDHGQDGATCNGEGAKHIEPVHPKQTQEDERKVR